MVVRRREGHDSEARGLELVPGVLPGALGQVDTLRKVDRCSCSATMRCSPFVTAGGSGASSDPSDRSSTSSIVEYCRTTAVARPGFTPPR